MAVQVVGQAVDDVSTKSLGDELIGHAPAAADQRLGTPIDVWRQLKGSRQWRVYPTAVTAVANDRWVVQVAGSRIIAVTKVKIDPASIALARKVRYGQKTLGKVPQECEWELGLGPPVVTATSERTGHMVQLYDAKVVEGIGRPQYCRLRFDGSKHCTEVALVDVTASTTDDLPR